MVGGRLESHRSRTRPRSAGPGEDVVFILTATRRHRMFELDVCMHVWVCVSVGVRVRMCA